jgi:hypothetical protein
MQALSNILWVFGQHTHPILILVFFSSGLVWRTKFTTVTPERKN